MSISVLCVCYAYLRAALTIGMLLTSWLVQSCTPREVFAPSPLYTPGDTHTPADAPVPQAIQALPVVMAFTHPSACVAFEQDGYPCRRIEQEGTLVGVEAAFDGGAREGLPLAVPGWSVHEDWRGFDWLELEIENRGPERLTLGLILRNEPAAWEDGKSAGFRLALDAAHRVTWRVPLQHLQYTASGWAWELGGEAGSFNGWGRLDLAQVREVRLTLRNGDGKGRLGLYRAELVGPFDRHGWVDRYGQRKDGMWPRKVHSDAEIIVADVQEQQVLDSATRFADRDHYQAWAKGPKRCATGYFRVERLDGRWWFIAPNGRLFFATGINVILHGIHGPINERTQAAYEWLPARHGRFAKAWNDQGASFHVVNQIRKWGEGYAARYRERAVRRRLFWGFTSIGNWSDWTLLRGVPRVPRLPYVTYGPNEEHPTSTHPMQVLRVTETIHDAFHSDFERETRRLARYALAGFKDDPWVLGHFIANEPDWDRFAERLLAALPYVIDGHYFQYWDEPITGRFDSETAYNGIVIVVDIPSESLVAAARATNARIYTVHAGVEAPFAEAPRKP